MKNLVGNKTLIMDGAMGTELIRRGVNLPLPLWSAEANLENPDLVLAIHQDYVSAGADILTTNTFRTTTWTYRKAGFTPKRAAERARAGLMKAVELARTAQGSLVAGSITAIEDCYRPNHFPGRGAAEDTYGETVEWFMEAGVDVILFETMGHQEEIEIALNSILNFKANVWLSLILQDGKHLLSGHDLGDVYGMAEEKIECLMMNCNRIETTDAVLEGLRKNWIGHWGVYPNLGTSDPEPDGIFTNIITDEIFKTTIENYINKGASVIGACCGSTPAHIRMVRDLLKKANISA